MSALIYLLMLGAAPPSPALSVSAPTPSLAVLAATRGLGADRAPKVTPATFLGMPRPGPQVEFIATLLPSAALDRVSVEVEARVRGTPVSRRAYELPLAGAQLVMVPVRTLLAGTPIAAGDLEARSLDLGGPPGRFATADDEVIGKIPRVTLLADRPVPLSELRSEKVISRGEEVRVVVSSGSLEVAVDAEALEDGALGARIKVRNRATQRIISATVTGPRLAEVERP